MNNFIFESKLVLKFVLITLLSLLAGGRNSCSIKTIESVQNAGLTADLDYRICGSHSGFAIPIYNTEDGKPKSGKGDKEPFLAGIKSSEPFQFEAPPIHIEWANDKHLVISHDTRSSAKDSRSKLMIFKAEKEYFGVNITYEPDPIIWK